MNKELPQNTETERALIGSLLTDGSMISAIASKLKTEDFYLEAHRKIYEAIVDMEEKQEPIDLVTLEAEMKKRGNLQTIGGVMYLMELASEVNTAAHAEHYADIVKQASNRRALIKFANECQELAYSSDDISKTIDIVQQKAFEMTAGKDAGRITSIKELLLPAFEKLESLNNREITSIGIQSGFAKLDDIITGLQPCDLIIIAARPSMGKTAFALNVTQNIAKGSIPVCIFSLEMSREQLVERMLLCEARVSRQDIQQNKINDNDWLYLANALSRLSEQPIYIDDTAGITLMEIKSRARKLKAEHGLGLVIIDYLQLMHSSKKTDSRQQEISEISRSLKRLAKELEVPVIALSQLSRAVESRIDKRPMLSDLRESGSIEQDADIVVFIYRDEYYKPDSNRKGIAEIIIAKQRNGPTGTVELGFRKDFTRFENRTVAERAK